LSLSPASCVAYFSQNRKENEENKKKRNLINVCVAVWKTAGRRKQLMDVC
jgi:hypothetical protein